MSGESTALENLRARIGNYLREIVKRYEVTGDGSYSLRTGTTRVIINPRSLSGADRTIVNIFAFVAIDVNVTNELIRYLNEINAKINFGKFFVIEDKKLVICQHSLLGATLDKDELAVGLAAIAYISDQYDENIVKTFGGKRCIDAENEALRRFPPGYTGRTITG
jgi:hypothetical protein